ncbi:acetyltransferase [Bordetella genomosp. 13]|uniref:Transferase n=1 Tax=Bordetella genomosp. 13 TaxID=463040 RepID=A0A1W6ZAJ4_9BORD|nr:acetyltransferase [Bordetella genomosp. 13]ARP94347.1 hypothetical protein CAL15_08075 [Bordetella genomosp. 13]
MTSKPLIIFGIGSLAQLAHYYATREMRLQVAAFAVDARFKTVDTMLGLPVLCWEDQLPEQYPPQCASMFVAVGYRSMKGRQHAYDRATSAGYDLPSIVSNAAFIAETARMGSNNFIMPGAVIEPEALLGANNVVWSNATLCHHTRVGNHNFFASNVTVGGEVSVGSRNFLGFSSIVLQHKIIGDDTLIAAGSLLTHDAESLRHYQGSPARAVMTLDPALGVCVIP